MHPSVYPLRRSEGRNEMFGTLEHGYIVVPKAVGEVRGKVDPLHGWVAMASPAGLTGEREFTSVTRLARR